jgi:sulfate adenylyltransferase
VFTPLTGFMGRRAVESVLAENRLPGGPAWTVPIVLDAREKDAQSLRRGMELGLADEAGTLHGVIEVSEVFAHDRPAHARRLYGMLDAEHPGVRSVLEMGECLVAGDVHAFAQPPESAHQLSPAQSRQIFEERGFRTVAGFQTRNVLHRAHEYLQRTALEIVDGLFIQPLIGWKKKGDYEPSVILDVYPKFIKQFYPRASVVFGALNTAMRYAGPKEAAFHAIIRKNFGCTHFIVGRDHAGVGGFYGHYEAQEFLATLGDIGIEILAFKEPIYCDRCRMIVTSRTCGHERAHLHPVSGTIIRKALTDGHEPPDWILRPEVFKELRRLAKRGPLFHE